MATLFERISLICRSKANALIEKFENPAELIAQTIIDAKKEYAESVKASAEVFAAEKKALDDLQALKDEKAKYETVAEKAVLAGNDDDARQALLKVDNLEGRITNAENRYLIARKAPKLYMKDVFSTEVNSITTAKTQVLCIDGEDAEYMRGKRVLIVDDVISTGESLKAVEKLVRKAGGEVVGRMSILAEGDAKDRDDIIFLEHLPLFNADGTEKE